MKVLFIFLDGIGLGKNDPETNPFMRANMPTLARLLDGRQLTAEGAPYHGAQATLLAIDPNVGVDGLPQSATGQAILMTGRNVSAEIGYHYGPKPNPEVAEFLKQDTVFGWCVAAGKRAALLNAYPPRYFDGIDSGKRLYSSIPLAVTNAGLPLFTEQELFAGRALSADFTGEGWRTMLGFADAPLLTAPQAGRLLATLAMGFDFSLFEYWASDYAGHKQQMDTAVGLMETFDGVLSGLVETGKWDELLLVVTSDHGNMEDLSTRKHTAAMVPLLAIGEQKARETFIHELTDLTHVAPAMWRAVEGK
jgi:2,3-bisphosphoglycerate-independent phosphoglycerate mutase